MQIAQLRAPRAGLAESRHIGAILVHPKDPDRVLVAMRGSGVWRSDDGGEHWRRLAGGQWAGRPTVP